MTDNLEERVGLQLGCWEKAVDNFEKFLNRYKEADKISVFGVYQIVKAGKTVSNEEMIYEKTVWYLDKEDSSKFASCKEKNAEEEYKLHLRFTNALDLAEKLIGAEAKKIREFRDEISSKRMRDILKNPNINAV